MFPKTLWAYDQGQIHESTANNPQYPSAFYNLDARYLEGSTSGSQMSTHSSSFFTRNLKNPLKYFWLHRPPLVRHQHEVIVRQ